MRQGSGGPSLRVLMQSQHAGGIIGKGGERIKRLRADFGAQVFVPDNQATERVLTIEASQDQILKIMLECIPLCHEPPYSGQKQQTCDAEINVLIQTSQVGGIIGKGG